MGRGPTACPPCRLIGIVRAGGRRARDVKSTVSPARPADRRSPARLFVISRLRGLAVYILCVYASSCLHISLRVTRSAWTTPDQRVCWLSGDFFLVMTAVSAVSAESAVTADSDVRDAGLVMRGRVVVLNTHQVWMPRAICISARVVDPGGVVIAVGSERAGVQRRDLRSGRKLDHLGPMLRRTRGIPTLIHWAEVSRAVNYNYSLF